MKNYSGYDKPYIWVYYREPLSREAENLLLALEKEGILCWHPVKKEMDRKERRRLQGAHAVLFFTMPEDLSDPFFRDAVNLAVQSNKRIPTIYLKKPGAERDAWTHMQLDSAQALVRENFPDDGAFLAKLKEAEIFSDMKVTKEQKTFQRRRGLAIVLVPLAAAAVLFVAVVYPLLIVPARQQEEAVQELGLNGLSKEELESVTDLKIIGTEIFTDDVRKIETFYNNGQRSVYLDIEYMDGHHEQAEMNERGTIEDLSVLAILPNLESVELINQKITDISPLFELKKLRSVHLDCNPVSSIEGIEALENLEDLRLSGTNVTDLTPLVPLKHLSCLMVNGCPVSTLPLLSSVTGGTMNVLELNMTLIKEVPYLGKLKNLSLQLHGIIETPTDFSFLKDVESFHSFGIDGARIEDMLPSLQGIPITEFSDAGIEIETIGELNGLDIIEALDVCHSRTLSSLEGIEQFKDLKHVGIKDCPGLTDLTPLYSLPKLESVTVSDPQRSMVETQLKDLNASIEYRND